MFCQFCGKEISDNSKFCNYCGEKQEIIVPTKKICPKCKTDFEPDMSFCNECGSKLIEVPENYVPDDVKPEDEPVKKTEEIPADSVKRSFMFQVDNVFTITGKGTVVAGIVTNGEMRVGDEAVLSGKTDKKYRINGIECFHNLIDAATEGMSVGVLLDGAKADFKEFDTLCSVDTAAVTVKSESVPAGEPVNESKSTLSETKVNVSNTTPQNNSGDEAPILEYKAGIYNGKGLTTFLKCVANIKFYPDRIDYESNGNILTLARMSDIISVKSGMPVYTPLITKSAQIELRDGTAYTIACPKGVYDNVQTIIDKYKG